MNIKNSDVFNLSNADLHRLKIMVDGETAIREIKSITETKEIDDLVESLKDEGLDEEE